MRRWTFLICTVAAVLAVPLAGAARAETSVHAGFHAGEWVLVINAEFGSVNNDVFVEEIGGDLFVSDFSAGVSTAEQPQPLYDTTPWCRRVDFDTTRCTGTRSLPRIEADLGDGWDTFAKTTPTPARVYGGRGNDRLHAGPARSPNELVGGEGYDRLTGGSGTDVLTGGPGADELAGGGGLDVADYGHQTVPVDVSIDGIANDGEPGEDDNVATDVETAVGGSADDRLTGNAGGNRLVGGAGDDDLYGMGGGDILIGGPGADLQSGGDGADSFLADAGPDGQDRFFGGGSTLDTVSYAARSGDLRVDIDAAADDGASGEGDNVWTDVERLTGGAGTDWLLGSVAANLIDGGPGADLLSGRAGNDTLLGQAGNDTVIGGDGDDSLTLGTGSDGGSGGDGNDRIGTWDGVAGNDLAQGDAGFDACATDAGDREATCES